MPSLLVMPHLIQIMSKIMYLGTFPAYDVAIYGRKTKMRPR